MPTAGNLTPSPGLHQYLQKHGAHNLMQEAQTHVKQYILNIK